MTKKFNGTTFKSFVTRKGMHKNSNGISEISISFWESNACTIKEIKKITQNSTTETYNKQKLFSLSSLSRLKKI